MPKVGLKSVLFAALLLMGVFFLGLTFQFYRFLHQPLLQVDSSSSIVHVERQMSAHAFVQQLKKQNLLQSPRLLLAFIRVQALSQQLKAGIYEIHPGESALSFLYRVIDGDVLQQSLRIIEGSTLAQISLALERAPYLNYHAKDWKAIAAPHATAEGLLLADTYHYDAGTDSKSVLELAHQHLEECLQAYWQTRSPNLPYKTPYELLIAASILEKEAAKSVEKHLISGVIVNRLRKHMPLQMDPTVIYAMADRYTGHITRDDLHIDSPYNTYRYRGLPPTPIAMVGKDAIEAAAHPKVSNYLYFVATGDGGHVFSVNYEQQKRAVVHYLKTRKTP